MPGIPCVRISLPLRCSDLRSADDYWVSPLKQGMHYIGPQRYTHAQGCECNTVVYRCEVDLYTRPGYVLTVEL